jgi:hypothetical protein
LTVLPSADHIRTTSLRSLSSVCPSFAVYKHVEDALAGRGDADTFLQPSELSAARECLTDVARSLDVRLVEWRYGPAATSFYLASREDRSLLVEIDVNTAPRRMALTWLTQIPSEETECRDGIRVVRRPVAAVGSYLYYHTRVRSSALPKRERAALQDLTESELERSEAVIYSNLGPRTGGAVSAGLRRQHERLLSARPTGFSLADMILPVRLLAVGFLSDPLAVVASVRWRIGRMARARRAFIDTFVRSGRDIEGLGGWQVFIDACRRAGGVELVA